MKILALDTSTEYCSLALWLDGNVLCKEVLAGQKHTELLLPMLQAMLAESGLALTQLDGFAFGAGPGSFTGLRIACGIVQGLAFATDLPVIGISTLEALAQRIGANHVMAALDARMGEIYYAAYTQTTDGWSIIQAPILCLPQHIPQLPGGRCWVGCGSGFDQHHELLSHLYSNNLYRIEQGCYPHAQEIARLAAPKLLKGLGIAPEEAAPVYIRNKVALKENER
ncbi:MULTISPECIES: tRNA (adenosine(37)-N6)-threonylcarbamoyltransferase complex dimerization subunit type 1 TsaB [Nitrosomonas]|uniref:tRNA threonylcarbamoyladenosine biosynthesis protein TsaB n=1 Tax=Nitrosomonas communis TaxID=44574 RepID=A0A0F7KI72_9PROT|nr:MULTISPECIES: tRNA (adenosine(37)-N6)-threonylcarbamoyltransferase complex dimerization subunit type 1 TsaB [Nitrosomonas]AKH38798.1 glycoprotease [Nitrosomonas communis]TYP88765.1 tRNA threonylcarbamoyladenosine biosynthesis protein TsaB [Nitrosomonas communis]UVS60909.1 tRNA (adenosine(37)-N6)-threonylcarbamoyltransferase complex dimerization subunit type 1 TsaB [Nitrosomonas sp. PLL12]